MILKLFFGNRNFHRNDFLSFSANEHLAKAIIWDCGQADSALVSQTTGLRIGEHVSLSTELLSECLHHSIRFVSGRSEKIFTVNAEPSQYHVKVVAHRTAKINEDLFN